MKLSLNKGSDWLKRAGEILITPVSLLPLAGLLIMAGDLTGRLGFIGAGILTRSGSALILQFPLFVAITLAYGLASARNGAAALTAAVSYLAFGQAGAALFAIVAGESVQPPFNMGLLGGILVGLIAAALHNTCRSIRLPSWLRFFEGIRLSAMLAVLASILAGTAGGALWATIQGSLADVAARLPQLGAGGAFSYGLLNRLLLPFGLHHVLNQVIWFDIGEFTSQSGQLVTGDLNRFLAGDPTAGRFLAGFYPMMIFGVPAIALCFTLTARIKNRTRLYLLMAITALVSLISGVTEPLEYLILFVSPLLYVIYALLFGLSMLISYQLQIHNGFAFSTGLTDYLAFWNNATHPERIWQVGLLMALLSFAVTYFCVTLLGIPAPGRDAPEADDLPMDDQAGHAC